MRHYFHIANNNLVLQSAMTIKAYDYTSSDPYYDAAQVSPLEATEDSTISGKYYFNVTTTGKYTIVITKTDATEQVLSIQKWLEGDDEVQNPAT